ncbi:MAG: hypothetical protein AB1638_08570 [Nitrospirota bacterium]
MKTQHTIGEISSNVLPFRRDLHLYILSAIMLFFILCLVTGSALADNVNLCTLTSKAALKACKHEAEDAYWIAIGNCNNFSTVAERAECKKAAKEDLRSDREDCRDQFEARQDVCQMLGEEPYNPVIDPEQFLGKDKIIANPNPYFPLIPGTTLVYKGGNETITVTVTNETKTILGVTCIVVTDVVKVDSEVVEDTVDWYAQDIDGNVWYFGEIAKGFKDGDLVSLEGSWKAGVDSAKPGIIMKAMPTVGDVYRQEFALGDAEDMGEVLSLTGSAQVPAVSCSNNCLIIRDFSPLEPGVNEQKFYASGIGFILGVNLETGERVELTEITTK